MSGVQRSVMLGDALATLGVQRTAAGRRRILVRAQVPFLVLLSIVMTAVLVAGLPQPALPAVLISWAGVVVWTVALWFIPWEKYAEITGIIIASIDLVAVGFIDTATGALYPTIGVLQVLPIAIVAFSFGLAGLIIAVLGSFIVSLVPVFLIGPTPSDAHAWISALVVPLSVSFLVGAVHVFSLLLQGVQQQLRLATVTSEAATVAAENEQAVFMTVLNTMDVGTAFVRPDKTTAFTNTAFRALVNRSKVDPETNARDPRLRHRSPHAPRS